MNTLKPSDCTATDLPFDGVKESIENRILNGDLVPGEKLHEDQLSAELEVGRGMIREALRVLEQEGLVTIIRNRGAFVRELSVGEALELYDLRSGLARLAGRLLAQRITRENIELLESLSAEIEAAAAAVDVKRFYDLNEMFHGKTLEFSHNRRVFEIDQGIEKELRLILRRPVLGPAQLRLSCRQHREILDALIDGDDERAASAFEKHVLMGKQRFLDYLNTPLPGGSVGGSRRSN